MEQRIDDLTKRNCTWRFLCGYFLNLFVFSIYSISIYSSSSQFNKVIISNFLIWISVWIIIASCLSITNPEWSFLRNLLWNFGMNLLTIFMWYFLTIVIRYFFAFISGYFFTFFIWNVIAIFVWFFLTFFVRLFYCAKFFYCFANRFSEVLTSILLREKTWDLISKNGLKYDNIMFI